MSHQMTKAIVRLVELLAGEQKDIPNVLTEKDAIVRINHALDILQRQFDEVDGWADGEA